MIEVDIQNIIGLAQPVQGLGDAMHLILNFSFSSSVLLNLDKYFSLIYVLCTYDEFPFF